MDCIKALEKTFLERLTATRQELSSQYPQLQFKTWSSSVGGNTTLQGHNLGLEVLIPQSADEHADNVALCIGVRHLDREPQIDDASVCWGLGEHPNIELELVTEPIPFTESNLRFIDDQYPKLAETLEQAIKAHLSQGAT